MDKGCSVGRVTPWFVIVAPSMAVTSVGVDLIFSSFCLRGTLAFRTGVPNRKSARSWMAASGAGVRNGCVNDGSVLFHLSTSA